jgi:hypothetical protein
MRGTAGSLMRARSGLAARSAVDPKCALAFGERVRSSRATRQFLAGRTQLFDYRIGHFAAIGGTLAGAPQCF